MFFKGEIPFVRFLLPFLIGIGLELNYNLLLSPYYYFFALSALFVCLVFLNLSYKNWSIYKSKWLPGLLIYFFLIGAGFSSVFLKKEINKSNHFSRKSGDALVVNVISAPKISHNIARFLVESKQIISPAKAVNVSGKLLLALKIDSLKPLSIKYSDQLLIDNQFTEIEPPYNPQEFDYKAFLANQQVYHQAFINQEQVYIIKHNAGNRLLNFAIELRKNLVDKIQKYFPGKESAAIASTLILGYRADLSRDVIDIFSKTGTMHVLSVSGMHVGIVFLLLSFILAPLKKRKKLNILRTAIFIFSIWFYALITGFSPSVCRAATMLTFIIVGKSINRKQNSFNLLAISAFVLLLINPFYLMDVGFQLSYLAVAGLIYLHPKIYHSFNFSNKIADFIWNYTSLSFAAQLATFPISIYYFHQFPLYFLLSNLFIVIPVALIMYAGIAFLFIPFPIILNPLGWLISEMIRIVSKVLQFIEHLPFASLGGLWISAFQYLMIYLIISLLAYFIISKNKSAFKLLLVTVLIFCVTVSFKTYRDLNRKELIFYSLRKNSGFAFIHQNESIFISDFLADDKTKDFSVKPSLESRNVKAIKYFNFEQIEKLDQYQFSANSFQFANFKIFRLDRNFNKTTFQQNLKVNALMIGGNPKINLEQVLNEINCDILLLEATNPDYKNKRWKTIADSVGKKCYVLKKNPALVIKL
ncbi:MAG: ComEC/Rec2 family competence protein [Daejeonella sp.]